MTTLDRNESHDAEPTSTAQMSAMNAKIDALQADVRFFGHQMMNLIAYLNVKPCHCESCKATEIRRQQRSQLTRYELTNERKRMNLAHLNNSQEGSSRMPDEAEKHVGHRRSSAGGSSPDDESDESPEEEEEEDEDHDDPMQDDTVSAGTIAASSSPPVDWTSSYATTVIAGPAAAAAAPLPPSPRRNDIQGSSLARRGRKSKYCSAAEKRAVADFAQKYGIGSAAHKFKIPHGVAAYYHRKQYKSAQSANSATVNEEKTFFPENFNGTEFIERNNNGGAQNDAAAVATATNDASGRTPLTVPIIGSSEETSTARNGGLNSAPPCGGGGSGGGGALLFERAPSPSDYGGAECGIYAPMDKCGAGGGAHSGSPGFLRGRGRGRPKLIGDELDAELVEFMVQLKSRKRQHLTASQALHIARNYIATKSPGLLEEHGGQIKLKITWAMKLVSRIAEREREIQLGLPAGSLQNNGHRQRDANAPSEENAPANHRRDLCQALRRRG